MEKYQKSLIRPTNGLLAVEQMLGDKQEIEITKLKTQLTAERIDKERAEAH